MAQSDREANRALRARLDDVFGQYQRLRAGLDELQQRLAATRVTVESTNGLIRATVGPRGQLLDLKLDRGVYAERDPEALARTITATVQDAAGKVTEQVQEMVSTYLPAGSGTTDFLRDNDFGSLLRRQDDIMRDGRRDD